MTVKTKEKPKTKPRVTKASRDKELMHKTISNLTDVVSEMKRDVARIKMNCINLTSIEEKFSYQNIEILLLHIVIVSVLSKLLMMVDAGGFINSY